MPNTAGMRGFWARVFKPVPDIAGTRRDIQGVRALAVLAVLLNHTMRLPTGGFAGVEVRIERILPASTLVIVVTVATAALQFRPSHTIASPLTGSSACFANALREALDR